VSPTVSLSNVDSRFGLLVRTEQSGGRWVAQRLRASYGLRRSPTFYAFAPGVGPVERFRHSVNPVLSYSFSPRRTWATSSCGRFGARKQGYLGSLVQNRVTLQLATNLEAKLRARRPDPGAPGDSLRPRARRRPARRRTRRAPTRRAWPSAAARRRACCPPAGGSANVEGRKLRVLSVTFSPLSYDFALADTTGRGFIDRSFNYSLRSDLLPGSTSTRRTTCSSATRRATRVVQAVPHVGERHLQARSATRRIGRRGAAHSDGACARAEQGGGVVTPAGRAGEEGTVLQPADARPAGSGNFPGSRS
jgi:hypothetical protein